MSKYIVTKADGTPLPSDEPVFVLRAQDRFAAQTVYYYAGVISKATRNYAASSEIMNIANLMEQWPIKKVPD